MSRVMVPGARRAVDTEGHPVFSKKGKKRIPVWEMPEPTSHDIHFKSAGSKRLAAIATGLHDLNRKAISDEDLKKLLTPAQLKSFTVNVPVYYGVDSRMVSYAIRQERRKQRLAAADKSAVGFIKNLLG